ncbi:MAG: hypothetical protein O7H39_02580 [Gammaproteobacteria bacterium]|nr:hypothetical protein [Gammaproteobacteria bacterium]
MAEYGHHVPQGLPRYSRPVYDWFTEGFDTAELKVAQALLDELS